MSEPSIQLLGEFVLAHGNPTQREEVMRALVRLELLERERSQLRELDGSRARLRQLRQDSRRGLVRGRTWFKRADDQREVQAQALAQVQKIEDALNLTRNLLNTF